MFQTIIYSMLATAEGGGSANSQSTGSAIPMFVLLGGMLFLMYLLIMRPQQREKKERQAMVDALKKGDKVVTIGGIYGIVSNVKGKTVTVKVADNVKLEMLRSSIAQVVDTKDDVQDETPAQSND